MSDPSDPTPKPVDRVYLDTQPLRESQWPHVSVALSSLLSTAKSADLPVFLPEVVERERTAQFLRDYQELVGKYTSAAQAVRKVLATVGLDWQVAEAPVKSAVTSAYEKAASSSKTSHGIRPLPASTAPAIRYLEALLNRQAPFDQQGKGLGDAMIYESVADDLESAPGAVGLLVTGDSDFANIQAVARRRKLSLRPASVEQASKEATDRLAGPLIERFRRLYGILLTEIQSRGDEMATFLKARLSIPVDGLLILQTVDGIEDIVVEGIGNVQTDPPLWQTKPGADIQLSITLDVSVKLIANVTKWSYGPARTVRVGEPPQPLNFLEPRTKTIEKQEVARSVDLQASAKLTQGENLENFQFVEAALRPRQLLDFPLPV
jgi:hypothetical protein